MRQDEVKALERAIDEITEIAEGLRTRFLPDAVRDLSSRHYLHLRCLWDANPLQPLELW